MVKFTAPALALLLPGVALAQTRIGEGSTIFRLVGPNEKVLVERTGGLSGAVGLAEETSRFSSPAGRQPVKALVWMVRKLSIFPASERA